MSRADDHHVVRVKGISLLAEVQAGNLKPYAAAKAANIVKVPTALDVARRAWAKMTSAERCG
jgi:hypothetical protein